jgi:hypothetical protein
MHEPFSAFVPDGHKAIHFPLWRYNPSTHYLHYLGEEQILQLLSQFIHLPFQG